MLFDDRLSKWSCQHVDERGFLFNVADVVDVCNVVDVGVVDVSCVGIVDVG